MVAGGVIVQEEDFMRGQVLSYAGAGFLFFWGVAHLFPTRSIVEGFGDISLDNRRIITMEWVIEGLTLIFLGVLVFVVTLVDRESVVTITVYWITFVMLNVLSGLSLFTGFRIKMVPFRLCPVIFSGASLLIVAAIHI
jgi:hypothetical protein